MPAQNAAQPERHAAVSARALKAFALAAPVLLLGVWRFHFVTDDAYIAFRYARHLARGHGLTFNPGVDPPVEGFSEFLWVLALAPIEWLRLDTALWSQVLSVAAALALLLWVCRFLADGLGLATGAVALGALWMAAMPVFATWSTGGLATAAFALLLFACYARLLGPRADPSRWLSTGLAAIGVVWIRADGLPWVLAIAALALFLGLRERSRGAGSERAVLAGRTLATALVFFGVLECWRLWYFGDFLPNTARAKVGLSAAEALRGAHYVARFFSVFPVVLLILAPIPWLARRRPGPALAGAVALVALTLAHATLVGGDFMSMFRFLVPAIPFLAVLLAITADRLLAQGRRAVLAAASVVLLAGTVAPGLGFEPLRQAIALSTRGRRVETQLEHLELRRRQGRAIAAAELLRRYADPGSALIGRAIGVMGYHSGLTILDTHGLVHPGVARIPVTELRVAGHDRVVGMRFFEPLRPEFGYAGTHVEETLRSGGERVLRIVFERFGDEGMMAVYRPVLLPLPAVGEGPAYLLLAERCPGARGEGRSCGCGSPDHGWRGPLLAPGNLRSPPGP